MSFVNPAPDATQGRTDQGVDWSNVKSIVAVGQGKIVKVYSSLSGFGQTIIERLQGGSDVYYATETSNTHATVAAGQTVTAGETIASGGTGGVIEAGFWDSNTGRPVGAPGYVEGKQTTAGQRFAQAVATGKYSGTRPGGDTPGGTGKGVQQTLQNWEALRDAPRTAPAGTKNPFQWWYASFTGQWDNLFSGSGVSASDTSVPSGGQTYGQVSYDQVAAIGKAKGWNSQQINDWFSNLIPSESNGTITDTNPSTGAYGLAQGIDGPRWYNRYGGNPNTVIGQLTAMANYIQQRYGDPSAAWAFHKKNNWY